MRKTKIVCTLGPSTDKEGILEQLILEGMNVARFNFSHGSHEEQGGRMEQLRKLREKCQKPVAALLDTKGPEIRLKNFKEGKVFLEEGQQFILTGREVEGDASQVTITYPQLAQDVQVGTKILIDDGLVGMKVEEIREQDIICRVLNHGAISNHKGINVPGIHLAMPYMSEKDRKDILFGIEQEMDFVAASFTRSAEDVLEIRKLLDENGGEKINIIAKIENGEGVENIDAIIEAADGIMIARGDLGVEIPAMEVPSVQKYLISKCRLLGKRVITATEMLESMIHNPRPTRAEVSDVANAVYDGTSAVMLSGETASGKYPVMAVKNMAETVEFTEKNINYAKRFKTTEFTIKSNLDAVSHSTCAMAIDVKAKYIIVNSLTGHTARMVSRFRCPVDIIGMTTSERGWRKLNMSWGVTPVLCEKYDSMEEMFENDLKHAKEVFHLSKGDNVVLTGGIMDGNTGNTNMIKVESI